MALYDYQVYQKKNSMNRHVKKIEKEEEKGTLCMLVLLEARIKMLARRKKNKNMALYDFQVYQNRMNRHVKQIEKEEKRELQDCQFSKKRNSMNKNVRKKEKEQEYGTL